jgi:DNA topoisomerase-2
MKMWSLTLERKQELLKQRDEKLQEVKDLEKKTPSQLWLDDLDNLLNVVSIRNTCIHIL